MLLDHCWIQSVLLDVSGYNQILTFAAMESIIRYCHHSTCSYDMTLLNMSAIVRKPAELPDNLSGFY